MPIKLNPLDFKIGAGIQQERVTFGVPVIDTNHAQIHAANAFSIGGVFTIAGGATLDITVQVPADAYVHYQATDISTNGGNSVTVVFYEGATVTTGGTTITPMNRHRIGTPPTSVLTVKQGATITGTGTEIDKWYFPKSSTNQIQNSISKSDSNEWVLKAETAYLFRFTNAATDSVIVSVRPFWYEESAA